MNENVVEMKINEHDLMIKEHTEKINILEKSDVKHEDNITALCSKIDSLILQNKDLIAQNNKWLYALLCGMAGILVKIVFFK